MQSRVKEDEGSKYVLIGLSILFAIFAAGLAIHSLG
jgi:hypothetical protein